MPSDKQFNDALLKIESKFDKHDDRIVGLLGRVSGVEGQLKGLNDKRARPLWNALIILAISALLGCLGTMSKILYDLHGAVAALEVPQKLQAFALDPAKAANAAEAQKLLAKAQQRKQFIEPTIVDAAGSQFLTASTPQAWQAANAFFEYRSFLNIALAPKLEEFKPVTITMRHPYEITLNAATPAQQKTLVANISAYGVAPSYEDSARIETLAKPNKYPSGLQWFLIIGRDDDMVLDGMWLKDVVVRNANIQYHGGSVRLENVYFVNCKFSLDQTQPSRGLGTNLLATAATTFSSAAS